MLGGLIVLLLYMFWPSSEQPRSESQPSTENHHHAITAVAIPAQLEFAGEPVPLQEADVRERIDRELLVNTFWHSNTLLSMKRANRWFPVIEPILQKNDVPDDFKYLALIESGLINVISPAGATGYWQFMEGAALEFGLEVNEQVDERYHIEKSTEAACQYLLQAKRKFGTWTMAAASYNMGMNGASNQIERQRQTDYYNLMLVDETARYLFRILAIKEVMMNPVAYGFQVSTDQLYAPESYETETITADIPDLVAYAESKNLTYRKLKIYNPWLRETYLKVPTGKTYTIKLPK